ncbi:MAG: hypothetical protein H0W28_12325 [Pyrinomonadaceae bacterium]|nr:hypothetical protein [Pyrinomonadaceae bacterium]
MVESSRRLSRPGSETTKGTQAISKKIDRGSTQFGSEKSQTAAENTIRDILENSQSAQAGPKTVIIRDGSGRGVKLNNGEFDTFFKPGGK